MPEHPAIVWLPRLLFRLTLGIAASLLGLVLLCPWLDRDGLEPHGWSRPIALFARDATLRRTTLASAVGLAVTACACFRPTGGVAAVAVVVKKPRSPKPPPPPRIAGA